MESYFLFQEREKDSKGVWVMRKTVLIALLSLLLISLLMGWCWAQGEQTGQAGATAKEGETTESAAQEPTKPHVTWGDYRYIFRNVDASADLDPQSAIMNWYTPDLYNAAWSKANYVHLYLTVEWLTNERHLDYMPLQLILHSGGRSYILFGKGCKNSSYLWRRGNHYLNDLGARYPDHVGGDVNLFFTFDTNGASIDPNSAYIEVNGMLEVWNWQLSSKLYTNHVNIYNYQQPDLRWYRLGSSSYVYTHLADIPLRDILAQQ